MATVVPLLQHLQRFWNDIVNVRKDKTFQAVCAHCSPGPRPQSVARLVLYTMTHWRKWWAHDQYISEVLLLSHFKVPLAWFTARDILYY